MVRRSPEEFREIEKTTWWCSFMVNPKHVNIICGRDVLDAKLYRICVPPGPDEIFSFYLAAGLC